MFFMYVFNGVFIVLTIDLICLLAKLLFGIVLTIIFKKALGYPKASHLDILCKGIQPL